jgi:glycosyltransferase involved in cell wall biosynthesis
MSESLHTVALIPAYNAVSTLAPVIEEARLSLPVVVVDDGSVDGTGELAARLGATVLRHPHNRGKGAALRTGFAWVMENGLEGVVTLDADGQHLASEIPRFLEARRETGADLIIGSRRHLFGGMLPRRRLANTFSAWGITWASGVQVDDSQSGFRFYSTRLMREVALRSTGFDLESEVIVAAARRGLKIMTIPIDLGFVDGLSTSHYRPLADSIRIAWTVFKTRFL